MSQPTQVKNELDHQKRHVELHAALDELVADYLMQHRGISLRETSVMDLMQWSSQQTKQLTHKRGGEQ